MGVEGDGSMQQAIGLSGTAAGMIGQQRALQVLQGALAPIMRHLQNAGVQEIMINAPDNIWIEQAGVMTPVAETLSELNMDMAIRALASVNEKRASVLMDARLPALRVAAVMSPVAVRGHAMCLRRHRQRSMVLEDYVRSGAFAAGVTDTARYGHCDARPSDDHIRQGGDALSRFLRWAVSARKNILVAGGTSSGKTTLANALLAAIPTDQRVITLEDTAELQLQLPNHLSFEANAALGIDIRRLVKMCLRFRPDRIVVGEIRGAEAYDLVDSLNTGHSGGITTIHADTAELAFDRLETLMRMAAESAGCEQTALRQRIAGTFNYIIQTANEHGRRRPVRVLEVLGYRQGEYVFRELYTTRPAHQVA